MCIAAVFLNCVGYSATVLPKIACGITCWMTYRARMSVIYKRCRVVRLSDDKNEREREGLGA